MPQIEDVREASGDSLAAPRAVPWGGLLARLRASQAARRCLPAPLALAGIDLAKRLAVRRDPALLAHGRAVMAAVVGGTEREADLDRLARRYLSAWSRGWELMWRPWLLRGMPVEGAEALADLEPGRGVLFSLPHFGPLVGVAALPAVVGPVHAAVGDYMAVDDNAPGYHGYQTEQVRTVLRDSGFQMVRATGSARTFKQVLEDGGKVLLNIDVPGKTPVRFLGKTVELASGAGRLAAATDAVVVPLCPLPRGRSWYVHVDPPLDPRTFGSWEDLLQATVTAVERLVLRAPEYLESPLRDGGWAVADRTGWRRAV